ncbi:glycosyltransferase family 2 protein [Dehalogenimonas formicexedens]|nr:glycosyltransferase family 2 protein [Dehalogenimonas formicexedens]
MSLILTTFLSIVLTGTAVFLFFAFEKWSWQHWVKRTFVGRFQPKAFPEWFIRLIAIIAIGYTSYYLIWRWSTFNHQALWFSLLLWAAELYGFIALLMYVFMTWSLKHEKPVAAPKGKSVVILVPTKGEPIDVLRATLIGCNAVTYPHRTVLLDDSGRPEVKTLTESLGCEYLARLTHDHAKAGNVNYGLNQTESEFFAVLDADNVPLPGLLDTMLGFFDDSKVAVVQGPQLFYNADSIQYEPSRWHEQRLFYAVIMPGKNRSRAAFWCGSPALLRRSAIAEVGGVATETVTEDLHTTLKLAQRGYRVLYVDKPVAVGLAPLTLLSYLKQRLRWGQGAMQSLRSKDSPFWAGGLSFGQRINFIASTTTYLDGLQLIILFIIPIFTLLSGVLPVQYNAIPFLWHLGPYLALIFATQVLLGRGYYDLWHTERYSILRSFVFTRSLLTLFSNRTAGFQVTPKEETMSDRREWGLIVPHLIGGVLCVIVLIVGVVNLLHPLWYQLNNSALLIVSAWVAIDLGFIIFSASRILSASKRSTYRHQMQVDVVWRPLGQTEWFKGFSNDLSSHGLSFVTGGTGQLKDVVEVNLEIASAVGNRIKLKGRVINVRPVRGSDKNRIGVIIEGFETEDDANRYFYYLHQPEELLRHEPVPDQA